MRGVVDCWHMNQKTGRTASSKVKSKCKTGYVACAMIEILVNGCAEREEDFCCILSCRHDAHDQFFLCTKVARSGEKTFCLYQTPVMTAITIFLVYSSRAKRGEIFFCVSNSSQEESSKAQKQGKSIAKSNTQKTKTKLVGTPCREE